MKFIKLKNRLEGLISYHYSPYTFEKPSYEEVVKNRPNRQTHSNSYLGLWSCTFPKLFERGGDDEFGCNVYKIIYKPDIQVGFVFYSDFVRYCRAIENPLEYITERDRFMREGYDVIVVVDKFYNNKYHHLGEIITLNFDCIDVFEKIVYDKSLDTNYNLKELYNGE